MKLQHKISSFISCPDRLIFSPVWSRVTLSIIVIAIIVWQLYIGLFKNHKDDYKYFAIKSSCGISSDPGHVFTYGLYYWGLFPVFPERSLLPPSFADDALFYSRDGASTILNSFGNTLRMDINGTYRSGIISPLWLSYVHALFKQTAKDVSAIPLNAAYFIICLLIFFIGFWRVGKGILGFLLVLLVGSYPFQIVAVYAQDNIFGYMISTVMLMMGLLAPLIFNQELSTRSLYAVLMVVGILLGFAYLIRPDAISALFGCILMVLLYKHIRFIHKTLLLCLLLLSMVITISTMHAFFQYKFNQALRVVSEKGGKVLSGGRLKHHVFWHTIWCGMEDFDRKYSHLWTDAIAETVVKSFLRKKYGINLGKTTYYNKPTDYYLANLYPGYDRAMREIVIGEILRDPGWYIDILLKRLKKILFYPLKPEVDLVAFRLLLPYNGFVYIIFLMMLFVLNCWEYIKLILFCSVTAAIPLFVTSGIRYHYYNIIHLSLTAVAMYIVIKAIIPLAVYKDGRK